MGAGVGLIAPPNIGDQVTVAPIEGSGDGWTVTGRYWTARSPVPTSAPTGKPVQSGELALVTPGAIIHLVGDTVHLQAAHIRTKGLWEHEGDLKVTGEVEATGLVRSLTDLFVNALAFLSHRHTGVRGGGDTSGPPQQ